MAERRPRRLRITGWTSVATLGVLAVSAVGGEHPRLLITPADLPRLRHACGIETGQEALAEWGKAGRHAGDYQAVRGYFSEHVAGESLAGEALAAAFLNVVDRADPGAAGRLSLIEVALQHSGPLSGDPLEVVLALDWCWNDVSPATRRDFVLAQRDRAEPLTPADSPLEAKRFRDRLAALALAVAVDETDDPSPSWKALRQRLLEAGQKYFETTFPTYVQWRGLSPTGTATGAREESDTALALEVARLVLGRDVWSEYRDSVGRWLEHYVLASMEHPALQHDFLHDDGTQAPLTSAASGRDLLPLTAHLIAARTRDPAAAAVADRVTAGLDPERDPLAVLWRWVPIAFELAGVPRCDASRMPTARNLATAVVFRGGLGPDATAVWVDAAQPFLRRRQHFDAGHFVVYRAGHLVNYAGDDVAFEALPSKHGYQRLGNQKEAFDFEQFFTSTIAHNCLVCWDAAWMSRWYGAVYQPAGGQRCIEGTCADFVTPLTGQRRATGRQLAYGQSGSAGYVALDLTPAYDNRALTAYSREFIFFGGHVLVVVDRVQLAYSRTTPTWVLNLPSRPQVDGEDLKDDARAAGTTNDGGVWHVDQARSFHWTERAGGLWLTMLSPAARHVRLVGGPAQPLRIAEGPLTGRSYVGGESQGYERLVIPAERHGAANAWYRLGAPLLLGPEFDKAPHWGRVEIEPAGHTPTHVFVNVLVTDRADGQAAPSATLEEADGNLVLRVRAERAEAELRLGAGVERGGVLETRGAEPGHWSLPTTVEPDEPLPTATK